VLILNNISITVKGVYNPKAFILHAALRRQTFVHCVRFPVAATRRCMGRVSVPFCPFPLSGRVPVIGLVGHYPTNSLMGDRLIHRRAVRRFHTCPACSTQKLVQSTKKFASLSTKYSVLCTMCKAHISCGISPAFAGVFHTIGEIPIHYSAVRN
jgi:hypothetical protein